MAKTTKDKDLNRDPLTGEPGSHPVGTGVGATGGAVTGVAVASGDRRSSGSGCRRRGGDDRGRGGREQDGGSRQPDRRGRLLARQLRNARVRRSHLGPTPTTSRPTGTGGNRAPAWVSGPTTRSSAISSAVGRRPRVSRSWRGTKRTTRRATRGTASSARCPATSIATVADRCDRSQSCEVSGNLLVGERPRRSPTSRERRQLHPTSAARTRTLSPRRAPGAPNPATACPRPPRRTVDRRLRR